MARIKRIGVWLAGVHVADLEQRNFPKISCRYTTQALECWPQNAPVLSCSLPLQEEPLDALAFCRGLLPEGQALDALARRAEVATVETFGLLRRYGRDVAGALVISESEPDERKFGVEVYSEQDLAEAVEELDEFPLGVHDDSELSLPGLQDKLLLVRDKSGCWARPLHGCPSTHILKRDSARYSGLVEAEAQCLKLAATLGLTNIDAQLETISGTPCLIVRRFDRQEQSGATTRLHQEDLLQAVGVDPMLKEGRVKYQRAGGPGLHRIADMLDAYAQDPVAEMDKLVQAITFNVAIGNADAHAKNVAFLHDPPGRVSLAPLYDTVPTLLWPKLRREMAMSVGTATDLEAVRVDDIVDEAQSWSHAKTRTRQIVNETLGGLSDALDDGAIDPDSNLHALVRTQISTITAS